MKSNDETYGKRSSHRPKSRKIKTRIIKQTLRIRLVEIVSTENFNAMELKHN